MMRVPQDVLAVLADGVTTNGNELRIAEQLERRLYENVNRVLKACGGKWDRRAQAHLFDGDAADAIEAVVMTGECTNRKQELGAFYTPAPLAARVVAMANIREQDHILEPSAGNGALAIPAHAIGKSVQCYEIDPRAVAHLLLALPYVKRADFLMESPTAFSPYDVVVMNPPFAKQADIDHVTHALRFLKPTGGRLVAIMANGVLFRRNKKADGFRSLLARYDHFIDQLPPGSFKESGTDVNAVVLRVQT